MRQVLTACLDNHPGIQVIGQAADPLFALDKMRKQWPDVLVLDVEMPRMDGITFLRKIMAERPTPSIICSTSPKPARPSPSKPWPLAPSASSPRRARRQPAAAVRRPHPADRAGRPQPPPCHAAQRATPTPAKATPAAAPADPSARPTGYATTDRVVARTSTGGTQALEVVLRQLPVDCPGIVIVQHMPEKFTAAFAQRLNSVCEIDVREARHMDRVRPGLALVAPAGTMQLGAAARSTSSRCSSPTSTATSPRWTFCSAPSPATPGTTPWA